MNSLSTHVLDTVGGCPAIGVAVSLMTGAGKEIGKGVTDASGRFTGFPELEVGSYRLAFRVADYFRSRGVTLTEPPFLDVVSIDFNLSEQDGHYHVPLIVSPFGYSTYRGS